MKGNINTETTFLELMQAIITLYYTDKLFLDSYSTLLVASLLKDKLSYPTTIFCVYCFVFPCETEFIENTMNGQRKRSIRNFIFKALHFKIHAHR